MKKINKRECGIVGISLGSMLIIVALLSMVGIGSGNTYASEDIQEPIGGVVMCTCPSGYKQNGNICTKSSTKSYYCCATDDCLKNHTNRTKCEDLSSCSDQVGGLYWCIDIDITADSCTCSNGGYPNTDGQCLTPTPSSCPSGQYKNGTSGCKPCPSGYYCSTGTTITKCSAGYYCPAKSEAPIVCPIGSYCPSDGMSSPTICPKGSFCSKTGLTSSATCDPGYTTANTGSTTKEACIPESGTGTDNACANKIAGTTCTTSDGKTGTCIASGSTSGEIVCKANASTGPTTESTTCKAGTYYDGNNSCLTCTAGFYCEERTYSHATGDISGSGRTKCPIDRPYSLAGAKKESECTANGNGNLDTPGTDDGNGNNPNNPNNPNLGTDGNGNDNNPNSGSNPTNSGTDRDGNNSNNGGNVEGNNTGTNNNPSTGIKTPLVMVIIGMVAMGLGTFTYYKSKNNEI